MRVGWLQDDPGYVGGAELTAKEFKDNAPAGLEIVDCPLGGVQAGLDVYVLQNVARYRSEDLDQIGGAPFFKYLHDVYPHAFHPEVRRRVLDEAELIFCSPAHRERMGLEGVCIPPPVNLSAFRPNRQVRRNGKRSGACSVAQWRNPGKGAHLLVEWAAQNDTKVDCYGPGPYFPEGPNIDHHGPLEPAFLPQVLWAHETFVFLPFDFEPFCRTVAEAYTAGCEVVTNSLIGATYWLERNPDAIETAAADFWATVTSARVAA